ncbi:ribulose-phosphate 3-epimerase [Halobacteroides halobius DSM 5150]|uniref:Ribulose-phosphate 3-epimerase n=1 Tax=Halobacteroides halobius (strain ATCC 35273 / DSM 5150 / MD-1) TaxID=748449 RepID=L0K6I1_HALHC|nr:ribulose-phosphate 3-epimerase [Halobacteroides halobius]AGB40857.1 ribulose-phosphate 3-epimerase [Halobacteroides halobius DSM 5150]
MIKVAPSILAADFSKLKQEIETVKEAEYLHLDVMDGHFVPNITIGPLVIDSIQNITNQMLDVHLMIENPDQYIPDFAEAGADIISVHAEACPHLHRTVQNIKKQGVKAAVALNPATPLAAIKHVLTELDMVLLMTVNPGFGGQSFISEVLPKIRQLKEMIDNHNLDIDIQVDGGVKPGTTAVDVIEAGANVLVAGSAIFGADDRSQVIAGLKVKNKV